MSMLKSAMQALDLSNATTWVRMGLKNKQTFDVFGSYFRGAQFPVGGRMSMEALKGAPTRYGVGAVRAGVFGFGAIAAWNMLPRSNALAIPAGLGVGGATAFGLGRVSAVTNSPLSTGLRAAGGLIAGSMAYQGLRSSSPSEYRVV